MKFSNLFVLCSLVVISSTFLSGCAVGSATAGYALKAQCADSLTACAEQRIVERVKKELLDGNDKTTSCK